MAKYKFICNYCGHIWLDNFLFISPFEDNEFCCEKCKDTNVKKILVASLDNFGYNQPKKKDKKNGPNYY